MQSKKDSREIMINDKADEVITELFKSLQNRSQNNLEESIKGCKFTFDFNHLLYYKCHKINLNCGEPYIDSPYCMKSKKAAINPINKKDNKWFQYAVTVELNHEETKKGPYKKTKIKPSINKYNWEGIIYPLEKNDWKKIEENNVTITLNILY